MSANENEENLTFCRKCKASFPDPEFEYKFPILFHGNHDAENSGYSDAHLKRIREK